MIINFSVNNWMSFKDKVDFSMAASLERQHRDRVARVDKLELNLLPISVIYGPNASGKSAFVKALRAMRDMVVFGTTEPAQKLAIHPFLLDDVKSKEPTDFEIDILIEDNIYRYSFSATLEKIISEQLLKKENKKDILLYKRFDGKINFGVQIETNIELKEELGSIFKHTRDNQLYLYNTMMLNSEYFASIYGWFSDLYLISPESKFIGKVQDVDVLSDLLISSDTGICGVRYKDDLSKESKRIIKIIEETLLENKCVKLNETIYSKYNGEVTAEKLVPSHKKADGTEMDFDISVESDGTRRLIEISPIFIDLFLNKSNKIYVIDELNRSLHPTLSQALVELYLFNCSKDSRTQLIFTNHDVLLMDQKYMRRDEMWVTEKDNWGASSLYSFSEFKELRYDKNIMKTYIQGRLGGIPKIFFTDLVK